MAHSAGGSNPASSGRLLPQTTLKIQGTWEPLAVHVRLPVHDLPAHHARVRVHWPPPPRYPARDFPCRARMPKYQTKAILAARIRLSVRWDVTHRALRMGCATLRRSVKIIAETVRADAVETCRCIYLVPGSYIPRNLRLISSLSLSSVFFFEESYRQ